MDRPLPDLLRTLSAELKDLADRAAALQAHMPVQPSGDDAVTALQTLDYLTQALACLAPFVAGLAHGTRPSTRVRLDSALDLVWMSALARRLGGGAEEDAQEDVCELFG